MIPGQILQTVASIEKFRAAMPPIIDHCIFCGASPTNKEHVFSRWSHKYVGKIPGKYTSSRGTESRTSSDIRIVRGKGDIHDWQVKCVDENCNNGWMRQLEDRAKPILLPLIQRQHMTLAAKHQRIIAGWAVLKAIIGEYETEMTSWSTKDLARMHRIQLPPANDCFVWAATVHPGDWKQQWLCYAFPAFLGRLPKGTRARKCDFNSAATTQIVGGLLLHVVHGPLLRIVRRAGYLPKKDNPKFPLIWPTVAGHQIPWTADPISKQEGHQLATGLYAAISGNAGVVRS